MNERIRELAREAAGGLLSYNAEGEFHLSEKEVEKFAELIVQECVSVLNRRFMGDLNREDLEVRRCIADVKQHFGVE